MANTPNERGYLSKEQHSLVYLENRTKLFRRTLKNHLGFQRDLVLHRPDSPRFHTVYDGEGHAQLFPIVEFFVAAHKKIVDSLENDLRRVGKQGDLLANGVINDVFLDYYSEPKGGE